MLEILQRGMNIIDRIRGMEVLSEKAVILFGALLVFGAVNCILGYRLLRFWMMLFGFALGAAGGLFAVWQFGVQAKIYYLAAAALLGIAVAVIVFLSYKAGIFIIGAGLGLSLGVYVIHPTSSLTFFFCILAGVGLGVLALRYEREVIILGTCLLGGVLAGFSAAKLLGMAELPYGILMSAGCALVGMLIQFAINRPRYVEDTEEETGETGRAKSPRRPSADQALSGGDFDEKAYRRIYESLNEEDIEEAYLREKVLNEDSSDPVEDFITGKIEDAREHRSRTHKSGAGNTAATRKSEAGKTAATRKSGAEKTAAARKSGAGKTAQTRREARPQSMAASAAAKTDSGADIQRKASHAQRAQKQVDFKLTPEDELALAHREAWERRKRNNNNLE